MVNGLSSQNLDIKEIFKHYTDLCASLRLYFSANNPDYFTIFASETTSYVEELYRDRLDEVDLSYTLSLLASLEASFRVDYVCRCKLKLKDRLSQALRHIYKKKKEHARLEDDILDAWKNNTTVPPRIISDMIGAFNLRNWLAHGRWWVPRLGKKYDFISVYYLANAIHNSFPFEQIP